MSQENVESFKRAVEATNRRDVEALLTENDPAVEFHSALDELLGGKAVVYRGHSGIRDFFRDVDEALDEVPYEYSEIRDLGDRVLAIGRIRGRGRVSRAEVESPPRCLGRFQERRCDSGVEHLRPQRSPRSRRAAGVGDVAGERRGGAARL
jgi:SnoaL-like domain